MKKSVALIAGVSIAAMSVPAFAQSNSTFTGPRAEAIVGYDVSRAGDSIDDDFNDENDQSIDGVVYGGAIGYDVALGGVVVGAEAEYTGSTAETEFEPGDSEECGLGNV